MTDSAASAANHREFTVARILPGSADLVFRSWTEPDRFSRWWGGAGTTARADLDTRPGGVWSGRIISDDDGAEHPFAGVYQEVEPPERLVFTLTDAERPDPERQHLVTVELVDYGGRTGMTFTQAGDFGDRPDEMMSVLGAGYRSFFDQLVSLLDEEA